MTTFPQRVIEAYERTGSPLLGRALAVNGWTRPPKDYPHWPWRHDSPVANEMGELSNATPVSADEPFFTQSLAWCLLAELAKMNADRLIGLAEDELFSQPDAPDRLLAACLAAEGRE